MHSRTDKEGGYVLQLNLGGSILGLADGPVRYQALQDYQVLVLRVDMVNEGVEGLI